MATAPPPDRLRFWELVLAVAVGFAVWGLFYYAAVEAIGTVRSALSDEDEDELGFGGFGALYDLSFDIRGTEIYYGQTLSAAVATLLTTLVALPFALRARRRRRAYVAAHAPCPHCLSPVASGAAVCANCGRDVAPAA